MYVGSNDVGGNEMLTIHCYGGLFMCWPVNGLFIWYSCLIVGLVSLIYLFALSSLLVVSMSSVSVYFCHIHISGLVVS